MLSKTLKESLVCTWCLGPLDEAEDHAKGGAAESLSCRRCGAVYAIQDGIANMLLDSAHLYCPVCRRELKKTEGLAVCEACMRQFSLRERIKL